ncbi:MAG TPA: transpeptidase, partial [Pelagibacteraceae bacterium]|nr:transpeptidase [Pelagibacteraceae bacterium]
MNIIIKKHLLLYKGYKLKCSIGKSGITPSKKEGDLVSPKG